MKSKIVTIGIICSLFLTGHVLFKTPFEFYLSYVPVVILLPFFLIKFPFPVKIMRFIFPLLIFGIFSVFGGDNTWELFFKIFFNIFIMLVFYHYVFYAYEFNVTLLTGYYMKAAFYISLFGVAQLIFHNIGLPSILNISGIFNKWSINPGGWFGIRLNSIFSEPSYFAISISPAFFIAVYNLVFNKTFFISKVQCIIVIVSYLCTFSSLAYGGIFIALLLILINIGFVRYVIVFLPIAIFTYFYLYNNIDEFRERVDGLSDLYGGEVTRGSEVHGSSFVLFNNFHVAKENFIRNPLFGTGLGSHFIAYDRYSVARQFGILDDFNNKDANSMALRLMSETGLFGLLLMLLFIIKFFVLRNKDNTNELNWVISSACLTIILLQLYRMGNYTYNGFVFYLWLYYYNYHKSENIATMDAPLPVDLHETVKDAT